MKRFNSEKNVECRNCDHETCLDVPVDHEWHNIPPDGKMFQFNGVGQLPTLIDIPD
jgi:hypothetical protein